VKKDRLLQESGSYMILKSFVGRFIVVLSNLKPAKLMGVESQGMLLAATGIDGTISILTLDREVNPGAPIK